MSEDSIPAPQYTLTEAMSVCLAMCHRALEEVRALAREPGPQGKDGKDGKDGERGAKGEPGRNASDLTFLQECINERVEHTIKSASVSSPDGGRTLHWVIGETVHEIKTAVVLDAGIWKQDTSYVPGDGVTWAGSFFIAQKATQAKPGESEDWRLAVKKGLDWRAEKPRSTEQIKPIKFK